MIENAKNKMEIGAPREKQVAEYHFAGSGIYLPKSVTASSLEEATAIWEKERVAVESTAVEEETTAPSPEAEDITS